MVSNDKPDGPAEESVEGSWSPRRTKASAKAPSAKGAKAAKAKAGDTAPDTEALAGEIERTREELAETLDAIAEKVSPKKVAARTKKKVGDAVKDGVHDAAEAVKGTASDAADAAKDGVAAVKAKVGGEGGAPRSPLTPPTSVETGAATPVGGTVPLSGAEVPFEPAPTPGALADSAVIAVEPAGSEPPSYPSTLPPAVPSRAPVFAGAGAALLVLLLVLRRRRR